MIGCIASATQRGIITEGLKLWLDAGNTESYPGTGVKWYDLSGSNNNGDLANGVTYSTANSGVMSFDGVDDYVSCGQKANLNITNLSISLWVKPITVNPTAGAFQFYVTRYSNTTASQGWGIGIRDGRFSFFGRESSAFFIEAAQTGVLPNIGQWYHLAGTKNDNVWKLYVDGILVATQITGSGNVVFADNFLYIGAFSNTQLYSNSVINDVNIYDYTLTSYQILDNFNALRGKYGI